MPNTITVKGKSILDTEKRLAALNALNNEGTTEELVKLQDALKDPVLRGLLNDY